MKIWSFIKENLNKGKKYIKNQYSSSSKGVKWMANILIPITVAVQCMGTGLPVVLDFIVFALISFVILYIARGLLIWLTKPICKPYFETVLNGIILFVSLFLYLYTSISSSIAISDMVVYAGLVVLLEHLFARSIYSVFKRRVIKSLPFVTLILSFLLNIGLCFFLFGKGIPTHTIENYLKLEQKIYEENNTPSVASLCEAGTYQVGTLDYGTEETDDLDSRTIDLSTYIHGNTGIKKWARQTYLGYHTTDVPLRGRIWYPQNAKNCPVVFIIHGNHEMITESYLGYAYLGEHLASRGYVVVSVDENVCNYYLPEGLYGENSARAYLLLENMRQVETYNEEGTLAGKLNYEQLALIGHSRGGEAVALAALYNKLGHNPDVGHITYNYDFSIQGVIAVAPSVDQYMPADRDVALTDINYLLVQGANDSDICTFMGMKQYNNIKFSGNEECYKSYIYIAGANHGQFNTTWQQDLTFPRTLMLNRSDLMESSKQRAILNGYVTAFLEDTLKKKTENRRLFQSNTDKAEGLPDTVYISGYEDSSFISLADYEEDISLKTITANNGISVSQGLCFEREQAVNYYTKHHTYETANHAAYLWWDHFGASYRLDFINQPESFAENNYLQFDVADVTPEKGSDYQGKLLNFDIVIKDIHGNSASVELAQLCNIYPPLYIRLFKLQFNQDSMEEKKELQTVRIPLSTFNKLNSSLDLAKVRSITFAFNKQEEGRILLDNIGISK